MEGLEKRLEDLLLHKTFSDLTQAEQEYVLHYFSAEEYSNCRQLLRCVQSVYGSAVSDITPNAQTFDKLTKALESKSPTESFNLKALVFNNQRVAATLALAAVGLLISVYPFFR